MEFISVLSSPVTDGRALTNMITACGDALNDS